MTNPFKQLRYNILKSISEGNLAATVLDESHDDYVVMSYPEVPSIWVIAGVPNYFIKNRMTGKIEYAHNDWDFIKAFLRNSGGSEEVAKVNTAPPMMSH